ncbi:MAG: sensor histidine kinase [Pseudomonadota bacterium]
MDRQAAVSGRADTWLGVVIGYGYTAVFSAAIAVLVWALGVPKTFGLGLAISFAIGFSVYSAFIVFEPFLRNRLPSLLVPIPITVIGLAVGLAIGGYILNGSPWTFFARDWTTAAIGLFFGVLGIIFFATTGKLAATREELAAAQIAQQRYERQLIESELKRLQAQIEPHFLFNTLSTITSLIDSRPGDARRTLEHLTDLLRSSLHRTRVEKTRLEEELSVVEAYLAILKIRMQDRLQFHFDISEQAAKWEMPPMLVQPLVENAVMHGLEPKIDGGSIAIEALVTDESLLVIRVTDDGPGIASGSSALGTGLKNIRERLAGLYGEGATLSLQDNQPTGVVAKLTLPPLRTEFL